MLTQFSKGNHIFNKLFYQLIPPTSYVDRQADSLQFQETVGAYKRPDRTRGTSANKTEKYVITVKSWNKTQSGIIKEENTTTMGILVYYYRWLLSDIFWYLLWIWRSAHAEDFFVIVCRYIMALCMTSMWMIQNKKMSSVVVQWIMWVRWYYAAECCSLLSIWQRFERSEWRCSTVIEKIFR